MEYYYSSNENERIGPLSIDDLKQTNITSKTLIWYEGLEDWKTAGQLPELKSLFEEKEFVREKTNYDEKLALSQQKIKELENKISNNQNQINQKIQSTKSAGYGGIYCSSDDKYLLGLCGGLAHKFGIPVGLVRLVFFASSWFFIGWIYFAGFFFPKLPTKNF
jgi:phage shock protein PspC (stress-responsive transcriptional regulator)